MYQREPFHQPALLDEKSGDVFLPKDPLIFIQSRNGHFYQVPQGSVPFYQLPYRNSISFSKEGLINLRDKYDLIHGAPVFINQILNFDYSSSDFKNLINHPECFPYFEEEGFLITPNLPYDLEFKTGKNPKSQKMDNAGISLNVWFIHPGLSSINEKSKQLLDELSSDTAKKNFIGNLSAKLQQEINPEYRQEKKRDDRTIGELKQESEYLASLLDLDKSHVPLLENLKKKTLLHLKSQYKVDENDDVLLYFHFPYDENTVTLHLHARVNQGFHPSDRGASLLLDDLICGPVLSRQD